MSPRPTGAHFPRILIRPRVSDLFEQDLGNEFTSTTQQMIIETEQAMFAIQDSVPVSIRDYSSTIGKGRGLNDDVEIFERALRDLDDSGGGTLFVPKGDYWFDRALEFSFDNILIMGEGHATTFHQTANGAWTIDVGNSADTTHGVRLVNFAISSEGVLDFGVRMTRCEHGYIDYVHIEDGGGTTAIGFRLAGGNEINIINCICTVGFTSDYNAEASGGDVPDNILVMHNHFETYDVNSVGTDHVIRDNQNIPIPSTTVSGAGQTIAATVLMDAPHQFIRVGGTAGGASPDTVDTIGVTYEGDFRTFILNSSADTVQFNDAGAGNLHLNGPFLSTAGQEDTISLVCDGTNWIEISRSVN